MSLDPVYKNEVKWNQIYIILEIISIKELPEEKLKEILMKHYPGYDPFLKQRTAFHLEKKKKKRQSISSVLKTNKKFQFTSVFLKSVENFWRCVSSDRP